MISTGPGWELRLGKWQDELADTECDAIICDPPYGARTHEAKPTRNDGSDVGGTGYGPSAGLVPTYEHWTSEDVGNFVTAWADRCRGWIVALTSSDLIQAWSDAFSAVGRYWFHPLPCVMRGMNVRLCGDGPSSWAVYAMVARPATIHFSRWGTLDGAYNGTRGSRLAASSALFYEQRQHRQCAGLPFGHRWQIVDAGHQ